MSESLSEIYASVESLSELMDVVNQSSESIALDVNNISLEMSEVLNISEMNSKNMEELSNLISTFKTERDE